MSRLFDISRSLERGSSIEIRENVKAALKEGVSYNDILSNMLSAMESIGEKFKNNVIFVPEVLIIGRAFNVALEEIRPFLADEDMQIGKVVMGTVYGDHHDVGKNIVKLFLESSNIKVVDLGINVHPLTFIQAIEEHNPDFLALSALLTTTMIEMEKVVTKIEEANLRKNLKIIIGGAPITENFAENIGADYYAKDAYEANETVKRLLLNK